MNSVDPESWVLAYNLKNERTAIPVVITQAVHDKRIDPNNFLDEGLKARMFKFPLQGNLVLLVLWIILHSYKVMDESLKNDMMEAKKKFEKARSEEKNTKLKLARRSALKKGKKPIASKEDQGW